MSVVFPVVGVSLAEVNYHRSLAVYAAALRVYITRHILVVAVLDGVGVVHTREVSVDACFPDARLFVKAHFLGRDCLAALVLTALFVNSKGNAVSIRRPELKGSAFFGKSRSQIGAVISPFVELCRVCLIVLLTCRVSRGRTQSTHHYHTQYS